jgi:hypothetical protein
VTTNGRPGSRARPTVFLLALVVSGLASVAPAQAHGNGPPARPLITAVEPAGAAVTATVVFLENWRIELTSTSRETVSVVDGGGRPFLRFGPAGVEADFGARAWFESNLIRAGRVVAKDLKPGSPADWRQVSSRPVWSWLDTRIRPEEGLFTPEVLRSTRPVPLRDFEIPLKVGERPGRITGRLEFEPPAGQHRHTILSGSEPFPGLRIGKLEGTVAPTLTVENRTGATVTILGASGEPMARMRGQVVEANLLSPSWVPIGQTTGQVPMVAADPGAPPRWERIFDGFRWSWPDFRNRPPDAELPPLSLSRHGTVTVKRWEIPIEVGSRRIAIRGMTEVLPVARAATPVRASGGPEAAIAGLLVAAAAFGLFRGWSGPWRREGPHSR